MTYVLVNAPSVLGLWASGVENLPEALRRHGLAKRLGAKEGLTVPTPPYVQERDESTGLLNGPGIRQHALSLSHALETLWAADNIPVVLGGDCSILIGAALGLKRRGRFGLVFLDGHADYYGPKESPTGEVADMDFAVVTGAGYPLIGDIDGLAPYFAPQDCVAIGARDQELWMKDGSQDVRKSGAQIFDLARLRHAGFETGLTSITTFLEQSRSEGTWVHFDADVLDDSIMPAVDYRLDGGLTIAEAARCIRAARSAGKLQGISVSIFNPRLDPDGSIAARLTDCLVDGLTG